MPYRLLGWRDYYNDNVKQPPKKIVLPFWLGPIAMTIFCIIGCGVMFDVSHQFMGLAATCSVTAIGFAFFALVSFCVLVNRYFKN